MRLIRKLNFLALLTGLAVGPLACGDDGGSSNADADVDANNNGDASVGADGSTGNDGSAGDADVTDSCEVGGETFSFFVATLDIGQQETEGEIAGLNIDGRDNTGSIVEFSDLPAGRPCQDRPDWTQPGSDETGIDNSVGKLLGDIGNLGFNLDISNELESSIASGTLMLGIRIHNVDLDGAAFPQNDDCVNAEILRLQTPDGWADQAQKPMPGQTINVHPESFDSQTGEPVVRFLRASIENGVLVGESSSTLPVGFEGLPQAGNNNETEFVRLGLVDSVVRMSVTGDAVTNGLIGAKVEVDGLADEVVKFDRETLDPPGEPQSSLKPLLEQLLANHADLRPLDPQTGAVCQDISVGMTYTGAGVTLMDPL